MLRSAAAFAIGSLILLGCYEPKDKFINPIKQPPSTIKVAVDVLSTGFKDPYPLLFPTTFSFSIDSTSNPVLSYQVFIDNTIVSNTQLDNRKLSFSVDPCRLTDGSHIVKIEVRIGTGSGSLADKLAVEYYRVEKNFTVVVDNVLPSGSQPLSFAMENGYLAITWAQPSKANFQYRIVHHSYDLNLGGDTVLTDPTINKYIDKGYVGGKVTYWINAFNGCSSNPTLVASVSEVNITPAVFSFSYDNNFAETVSWNQSTINASNTIVSYVGLFGKNETSFEAGKIAGDTIPFGSYDAVSLTIQRKGSKSYKYVYPVGQYPYGRSLLNRPQNFKRFNLFGTTNNPSIYVGDLFGDDFFKINAVTLVKEDSLSRHVPNFGGGVAQNSLSNDGSTGVMNLGAVLVLYNPSDFSSLTTLDFHQSSFGGSASGKIGNVSNNKLLGINYPNGYTERVTAVLDLNTNQTVWSNVVSNGNYLDTPVLSEDGNYFAVKNSTGTESSVFKWASGSWTLIGKVPGGTLFFRNHSTIELIVGSTTVQVFDLGTPVNSNGYFSAARYMSITLRPDETLHRFAYDEITQHIYFELYSTLPETIYKSEIKVYSVSDFSYKGKGVAISQATHLYSNGFHFSSNGFAEKIK